MTAKKPTSLIAKPDPKKVLAAQTTRILKRGKRRIVSATKFSKDGCGY